MSDADPLPASTTPPTSEEETPRKFWRRPKASAEDVRDRRIKNWAELWSTIILTLATLATAWAGYEAGKWSGIQTAFNLRATALRIDSTQLAVRAQELRLIDISLFSSWIDAAGTGNTQLMDFYRARFRDEFRPAFDAWLATNPMQNPAAADSPFDMSQYRLDVWDEMDAMLEEVESLTQSAEIAASIADQYTISIVILAGALLLAGLAGRFEWAELRVTVVVLALLVLLGCAVNIIRLPAV